MATDGSARVYDDLTGNPRQVAHARCTAVAWPRTAKRTMNHSRGWKARGAGPHGT